MSKLILIVVASMLILTGIVVFATSWNLPSEAEFQAAQSFYHETQRVGELPVIPNKDWSPNWGVPIGIGSFLGTLLLIGILIRQVDRIKEFRGIRIVGSYGNRRRDLERNREAIIRRLNQRH